MMLKMNALRSTNARWGGGDTVFSGSLLCGILVLALVIGIVLGQMGASTLTIAIGSCAMVLILLLQQDELGAIFVLVLHLYVDWYLGLLVIAPVLTCALLLIFYLTRSQQRPWAAPRFFWLWIAFLLLSIYPAMQGWALSRYDAAFYYPNIIVGALVMFWLGSVLARDISCVLRLFKMLAAVGTALALITIIQNKTGVLLFGTTRFDASLASTSNFSLLQRGDVYRLGSFFVNPDWNGAFFATILCIPLGLLIASNMLWEKILYLLEACIILPALLFTYSVGSWLSAGIGVVVFVVLVGRMRYRLWITVFLAVMTGILLIWFPDQVALLLQHGADPSIILLRSGAWKTAINIMQAFPLTGIGLGLQIYMLRAEPYRAPEQYQILAHPHNSYLELGAMAGIPVLVLFIALILLALWLALRTWAHGDRRQRSLLGGGIAAVIALSVNSLSVNVWTLPPLAAFGWLILGIASSPLLIKSLTNPKEMLAERHCDE